MTIKEMQKVYKKINKAMDDMQKAADAFALCIADFDKRAEHAKAYVKAHRVLDKIGEAMNVNTLALANKCISEESFVYWCLMNKIEYKTDDQNEEEEANA